MSDTWAWSERAVLLQRRRARRPRRELDVGLAEQRLLAQDGPRVRRQRRVAGIQLDRRHGPARLVVRLELLDLADRHAGDPHVGLGGELRRLGERDLHAVALGLERHGAAERQPQEQQQAEARQREHHHRGDPAERGCGLVHPAPWDDCGQISVGGRAVEEGHERAEQRVGRRHRLQQLRGVAGQDDEATPDRAVGVLVAEHGHAGVVGPREPEQVALLAVPGRVVRERVEQRVDDLERARQVRRHGGQVAHRGPQLLDGRQRRPGERADLVAQDRRGLAQERPRLAQRRAECAGARSQVLERRPEHVGEPVDLGQRGRRLVERARQQAQRLAQVGLLAGQDREDRVGVLHEVGDLLVLAAELLHQQREVVDDALEVPPPDGQLLVDLARVLGGRLDAPDRLRERAPVALERQRPVAEQDPQVVATVDVELREDLVEVDVRHRLRRRDPLALRQLAGLARAGVQLGHHVLQAGLGPQQDRRVAVDARVVALDVHADDRAAVLELDAGDLADLDAGDVDRLALPRRDRLRGRQLGLDLHVVLAQERHARRQRDALLGQDHDRHDQ